MFNPHRNATISIAWLLAPLLLTLLASCHNNIDSDTAASEEYAKRHKALTKQWKSERSRIISDVSSCNLTYDQAIERLLKSQDFFLDRYVNVSFDPQRIKLAAKESDCTSQR